MGKLVEKVRSAGVVGAGGAGFPTHIKYQASVEYLIANGAECEPLLYCDQSIMTIHAGKIIEGMELVMKEINAAKGIIALKSKYKSSIKALREAIGNRNNIHIHQMESFYPAGDEQVIVYEVLGRVVPEGGLPLHVGVVVNNVSTLMNVYEADKGINVTKRVLTVHGEVKRPSTFEVPVGTSIRNAIELAGGTKIEDFAIIVGGPMMGYVEKNIDAPVMKTTSGIIVLHSDHPHIMRKTMSHNAILKRSKASCDQCMSCTDLCPRYLIGHNMRPHMIMRALPYGISDSNIVTTSFLCCECGLCSFYACPLFLSPGMINSILKAEMGRSGIPNPHKRNNLSPYPAREERRISTKRLIERLGISAYNFHADMKDTGFIPDRVTIPLKQHLGAPSIPVVNEGDKVNEGQLIGDIPEGKLGARIHASIPGYVMSVGKDIVIERN